MAKVALTPRLVACLLLLSSVPIGVAQDATLPGERPDDTSEVPASAEPTPADPHAPPPALLPCAALSSDGTTIALSNRRDRILVWNTHAGQRLCELYERNFHRPNFSLSADGSLLVVDAWRGTHGFRIYETNTARLLRTILIELIAYDMTTGQSLGRWSHEEVEEYWKRTGHPVISFSAGILPLSPYPGFALTADGSQLWLPQMTIPIDDSKQSVRLLRVDTRSGEATPFFYRPPQLPRDDFSIRAVALGCGGEQLLALGEDMGFYVFRTADMTPVRLCYDRLSVPQNAACALSPDGRFAACVTSRPGDRWDTLGSGVLILDVRRATRAHQLTTPDGSGVSSLTFTSDSDSLVAGTCSGRVLQWTNAGSLMRERRPEVPHVSATLVASAPDSGVITAAYLTPSNESVRVDHWDAYPPGGPRSSRTFTMPGIGK